MAIRTQLRSGYLESVAQQIRYWAFEAKGTELELPCEHQH